MVRIAAGSLTVPFTVTGEMFVKDKFVGEVIVTVGITGKTKSTDAVPVLPAMSVASTETELDPGLTGALQEKFVPTREAGVPLQVTDRTPETLSRSVPVSAAEVAPTGSSELLTGDEMVTIGEVLSRLIATEALAVLPAMSVAVPLTTRPVVSFVMVCGGEQAAIPERESVHANETVGLELFHPAAFGAGDDCAVMFGGVLSRLMVTDAVALLPAEFLTVPEMT